jgi:hypothetical protein
MSLEKAVNQEHITEDTIDLQFCSDWMKDEIRRLFARAKELESENKALIELRQMDAKSFTAWVEKRDKLQRVVIAAEGIIEWMKGFQYHKKFPEFVEAVACVVYGNTKGV